MSEILDKNEKIAIRFVMEILRVIAVPEQQRNAKNLPD